MTIQEKVTNIINSVLSSYGDEHYGGIYLDQVGTLMAFGDCYIFTRLCLEKLEKIISLDEIKVIRWEARSYIGCINLHCFYVVDNKIFDPIRTTGLEFNRINLDKLFLMYASNFNLLYQLRPVIKKDNEVIYNPWKDDLEQTIVFKEIEQNGREYLGRDKTNNRKEKK